jgi:hypothetical protein
MIALLKLTACRKHPLFSTNAQTYTFFMLYEPNTTTLASLGVPRGRPSIKQASGLKRPLCFKLPDFSRIINYFLVLFDRLLAVPAGKGALILYFSWLKCIFLFCEKHEI